MLTNARRMAREIELLLAPIPAALADTEDDNTSEDREDARALVLAGEERYGDAALKRLGEELRALQVSHRAKGKK